MEYTSNQLLDELRCVASIVDRSPTEQDMLEHGEYAYSTYFDYFESWTRAKELAGVPPESDKRILDEELLDEVRRVEEIVVGSPSRRDMDEHGHYPSSTYKYRFGSWNRVLRRLDLPVNIEVSHTPEGRLEYGPDWENHRRQVLERDGHRCQVCGLHEAVVDTGLHVHHITPLRAFDHGDDGIDYDLAHDIDNLVSLCLSCHGRFEYRYSLCDARGFVWRAQRDLKKARARVQANSGLEQEPRRTRQSRSESG